MAHAKHGPLGAFVHEWLNLHEWGHWVGDWGISRALFLGALLIGLFLILGHQIPNLPVFTFSWLVGTSPVWILVISFIAVWRVWVWYIQSLYLSGRHPVLLEMKIPRDIFKSPRAMELAITNFNVSSGETTFLHRGWKGQVRPYFSMEIVSFGGEIHFYFWCWKNYKSVVESALYAQYPEIELHEVEDYSQKFQFDPEVHQAFATEWRLEGYGKDAGDFRINGYPFRTYVDFELDKDPKEEFKIEPFAQVLEFMSNIKPNEQVWTQIVFRKSGKQGILLVEEQDGAWKKMVEKEVEKVRTHAAIISGTAVKDVFEEIGEDEDAHRPPQPRATWRHQRQMESMERNLGKYPFEVGMRGIYFTTGELHGPTYTGMRWMWRAYGNPQYMTHIRPRRWCCDFDYPWQDVHDLRWNNQVRRALDAYRRRSFFHSPWIIPTNVFTNEMLASIWHPPSRTIAVPGLQRIAATKAEPPPNLPK